MIKRHRLPTFFKLLELLFSSRYEPKVVPFCNVQSILIAVEENSEIMAPVSPIYRNIERSYDGVDFVIGHPVNTSVRAITSPTNGTSYPRVAEI